MKLGDVANPQPPEWPRPLAGITVLAAEQMQALPYATQLLGRLGADIIKVEHPTAGDSGRGALPAMTDPEGRPVGATFLRNNLGKRSVGLDLKSARGRELFVELAGTVDVVAENFKAGTMARLGLGYDDLVGRYPALVYVSVSGFGNLGDSPYADWPAYAMAALGLGVEQATLTALRHRDVTGTGQHVDIAMLDAMVSMADIVPNLWSLGQRPTDDPSGVMGSFRAADGWFVMQVVREHQFTALANLIGMPGWLTDERLSSRAGWGRHLESVIRPAVESWAAGRTRVEVCDAIGRAGIPAGPVYTAPEVIADPHVEARHMIVEMPRSDDVDTPVLIPGNPVKMSRLQEGPETRVPWVGEHTDEVLRERLGLDEHELSALRGAGVTPA